MTKKLNGDWLRIDSVMMKTVLRSSENFVFIITQSVLNQFPSTLVCFEAVKKVKLLAKLMHINFAGYFRNEMTGKVDVH
jgi:hypothetical protein